MTQEQKDLLLKDLHGRLPYGVKGIITYNGDKDIFTVKGIFNVLFLSDTECCHIEDFKPYLFPLSSMTEEQKEEIEDKLIFPNNSDGGWIEILYFNNQYDIPFWFVDFCNKNHLDYRGLIPMGLANDATDKNIY